LSPADLKGRILFLNDGGVRGGGDRSAGPASAWALSLEIEPYPPACLRHLPLLVTAVTDDVARSLPRAQVQRLMDLSESMREYVIKADARRRSLLTEEETRACRRALVLLVGERYLFRPDPEE